VSSLSRNRKKYCYPYHYLCYEYTMYVIIMINILKIKGHQPNKTNFHTIPFLKHGFPRNFDSPPTDSNLVKQQMI
jgi:hypothetical protein